MVKLYFSVDKNNYLTYSSKMQSPNPSELSIEVAENHEVFKNPIIYKYVDGVLVKDSVYQQQLIEEKEILKNKPTTEQELADIWYAIMTGSVNNA